MQRAAHPDPTPTLRADRRRWAALGVLAVAVLLLAIDGTVLYLAVPALTRDLAPTADQILWIGDIYSLALAGLLVTMGTLADRIGRKKLLLLGSVAFGLASLLAAYAPDAETLIAARLLLGIAGATIMPSTLSLVRSLFPDPAERTRAIAVWSAAFAGGAALGPLAGGFLLEHFWWGAVFLINVPVMVLLLVLGGALLPESRDPEPGRFDLLSAGLSMATVVPFVYAVKHVMKAGLDTVTVVCLLVAVVAGVLFVRRQRRLTAPLLDVELFRTPAFSGAVLANTVAIFALTGLLFFFSQYLQLARGFSPLQAGLAELPTTLAAIGAIAMVGLFLTWFGRGRAIAIGLLITAAGLVLIAAAEGAQNYVWLALALLPLGLGVGIAQTLTTDAVLAAVPPRKAGSASAISETAYELGVVFGIAILGSVVSFLYRNHLTLPASLTGPERAAVEDSLAGALSVLDPSTPLAQHARESFVSAMQTTSLIAAAITAAAAALAWITLSPRRRTHQATA
ncbi:MFS transporter [Cellulomonas cellasea]|uniref:DHA2 family multidrug resistance protein-like MFS transporter n=1 Tax=Cellulomonas cellasea TaxID=43670 RepID=A0A7W4UBX5_9CELL|nr:MFS transporter [Cellulomonas cellasea]MBB2921269.1 DHA2 family multidrug resistance protein-like MFS transporter [Cellulomonas cellasea]